MAAKARTDAATRRSPKPSDPSTWPVVWRVVAPACSHDGSDWVFTEHDDETEARKSYKRLRLQRYPVRLERIQCGPLPVKVTEALTTLFRANGGTGETTPDEISGFWTRPEVRS